MAARDTDARHEELMLEEVRRPWWLDLRVGFCMGLGYSLRAGGWLIEHLGKAVAYLGREIVLALQRLDYPETQWLTDEEKRILLEAERDAERQQHFVRSNRDEGSAVRTR